MSQKGVSIRCFEEGVILYLSDGRAIPIEYDDYSALCDLVLTQEKRQQAAPKHKQPPDPFAPPPDQAIPETLCTPDCTRPATHPVCGDSFHQHPNESGEYCGYYHRRGTICGHPRGCHKRAAVTPAMRAMADFRHGLGQEANPYNKQTQHDQWEQYAWAMHTHWHKEFEAEQRGHHEPQEPEDAAERPAEPEAPGDGKPPF